MMQREQRSRTLIRLRLNRVKRQIFIRIVLISDVKYFVN